MDYVAIGKKPEEFVIRSGGSSGVVEGFDIDISSPEKGILALSRLGVHLVHAMVNLKRSRIVQVLLQERTDTQHLHLIDVERHSS